MKKIISIILSAVMIFTIILPMTAFAAGTCGCDQTPLIYVRGRASVYPDKDNPVAAMPDLSDEEAEALAKELLPMFFKAYTTNNYTEWENAAVAAFQDIYKDYVLDENGEITNNSGINWSWSEKTLRDVHKVDESRLVTTKDYSDVIYRYFFQYDCRRAPLDIADDLHEYIEAVKKVTGHNKVRILSRCLGTSITAAYLSKYGYDDIENIVIYNPIMNGTIVTDASFTGNLQLTDESLKYFADQELEDDAILNFLKATLTLMNENYSLKLPVHEINRVLKKIGPSCIPKFMKASYGSCPGYWAILSPDKYEEAKEFMFPTAEEKEKYAGLIAKNDEYHEKVRLHIYDIFNQMINDGVKVNFVVKYGLQAYPVSEDSRQQSDTIISLSQQSMGGTSADIGKTLSRKYLEEAKEKGTDKYISADNIVDASTGIAPDTTWYIKDLDHNDFPYSVDKLIYFILTDMDMTVFSNPEFPQYLVHTGEKRAPDEKITPLTEDNKGVEIKRPNIFEAIFNFFRTLIEFFKTLLNRQDVPAA